MILLVFSSDSIQFEKYTKKFIPMCIQRIKSLCRKLNNWCDYPKKGIGEICRSELYLFIFYWSGRDSTAKQKKERRKSDEALNQIHVLNKFLYLWFNTGTHIHFNPLMFLVIYQFNHINYLFIYVYFISQNQSTKYSVRFNNI